MATKDEKKRKKKTMSYANSGQDEPASTVEEKSPFRSNQALHPHGKAAGGARNDLRPLLQEMQKGRQETLNDTRSPFVRRSAGGRVISENEPEGIDSLRSIPHSWDEPQRVVPNYVAERKALDDIRKAESPFQIRHGRDGLVAMKGPNGGAGYSQPAGANLVGQVPTYGDLPGAFGKEIPAEYDPSFAFLVINAYNQALMNPDIVTQRKSEGGHHYDSGRGVDSSNFPAPAETPFNPHGEGEGFEAVTPGAALAENADSTGVSSLLRHGQGAGPRGFRSAISTGADMVDALLSSVIDPSLAGATRNAVTPFIGEQEHQMPTMTDPSEEARSPFTNRSLDDAGSVASPFGAQPPLQRADHWPAPMPSSLFVPPTAPTNPWSAQQLPKPAPIDPSQRNRTAMLSPFMTR